MIREDHRVGSGAAAGLHYPAPPEVAEIITADSQLQRILSLLPLYAKTDLPILLTGEPGTGKELVAAALCALSERRHRPLQRINCAALTESLAGSELFGHVRGAFTDARDHRSGKFKLAHQGTLFLDEVGDLPRSIQPRLLRAVEQGEIEPVGGDTPVKVDARLIAATNQDLPRLIAQGRFRQDLYDRLAVLVIHLPPLRERPGDIMLLAGHYAGVTAACYRRNSGVRFSCRATRRLQHYPWPGNVRELRNVVTRAVLFSKGNLIAEGDLSFLLGLSTAPQPPPPRQEEAGPARPNSGRLRELLAEEGGNISALARRHQVCTKTIYRWLKSHHIDLGSIRGAAACCRP